MKWTPVSERLPENTCTPLSANVLVTYMDYGRPVVGVDAYHHYNMDWCTHYNVVAWAPTPEPYSGKEPQS